MLQRDRKAGDKEMFEFFPCVYYLNNESSEDIKLELGLGLGLGQ
jgi:hypothetical protein